MTGLLIVLAVVVVLIIAVLIWAISTYNSVIKVRNLVQEAWRQIDVELRRRHTVVTNLIETAEGYARHERAVFDDVCHARSIAQEGASGPAEQARQENELTAALEQLFALAEASPQLRASPNFTAQQSELTTTEDRIAAGRRFYNAKVRNLNTTVTTFPTKLLASIVDFRPAEYFDAEDPDVRRT